MSDHACDDNVYVGLRPIPGAIDWRYPPAFVTVCLFCERVSCGMKIYPCRHPEETETIATDLWLRHGPRALRYRKRAHIHDPKWAARQRQA